MKNTLLLSGLVTGLASLIGTTGIAQPPTKQAPAQQSSPNLTLKIIPGATTVKYQDQVEFKAYLYNRTKEPIRIVNPNYTEPAWRLYSDEWLVIDGSGQKRNRGFGYDGADRKFMEKDVTVVQPGDSIYVRYFKFKFDDAGKFTVKYTLNHDPGQSYYKDTKAAKSLTVFRLESNALTYEIKQSAMTEIRTTKLLSEDEVYKEKQFTSIDDAFANAETVYRLKVSGVKQEDFNKICKLKNLRTLEISGAKIDSFPAAFNDLRLFRLSLDIQRSNESCLVFPAGLGRMTELKDLFVGSAGKIKLPDEIGNLTALVSFGTSFTSFETLPANFGNLQKLNSLSIYYNHELTSLPTSMSSLTQLQTVSITSCEKLAQFPAICNSTGMINLSLSDNVITSIPPEIGNLKKMNYFVMENDKLRSLPPQLLELSAIRMINVRKNQVPKDDDVVKALQKKMGKSFFL